MTGLGPALSPHLDPAHAARALTRLAQPRYDAPLPACADPRTPQRCLTGLTTRVLDRLAARRSDDLDPARAAALAANPATPAADLSRLASRRELGPLIATNPATPEPLLAQLARARDWHTRCQVARHPDTDPAVLEHLTTDADSSVVEAALAHPALPLDALLRILGGHPPLPLMHAAARHPALPADLVDAWATSATGTLRRLAGAHPHCPPARQQALAWSTDPFGQTAVAANPTLTAELAASLASPAWPTGTRFWLATNPALDTGVAALLAVDPGPSVRTRAAGHPSLTASLLAQLLPEETDPRVRLAIASHPQASASTVHRALHDGLPVDALLIRLAENHRVLPDGLAAMAAPSAHDPQARRVLASMPGTPASFLAHAASDPDPTLRAAAAGNPSLPSELVARLRRDPDVTVRAVAATRAA